MSWNYKPQLEWIFFQFWSYLSQIFIELLKCWIGLQRITISIHEHNMYEVMVIFQSFSVHGPIRTSPKGSSCGPPISGLVLGWLELLVAPFWSWKLDWTRHLNTTWGTNIYVTFLPLSVLSADANALSNFLYLMPFHRVLMSILNSYHCLSCLPMLMHFIPDADAISISVPNANALSNFPFLMLMPFPFLGLMLMPMPISDAIS